ncbi:MAG TPA: hypothetical protein ENI81_10250 [Phycisphaerales bacterium]|nr:hypothetical protein [Phycisphaerales bacterium]
MNDEKEKVDNQEESSNLQPCCEGGSCCPSGSDGAGNKWKIAIFILIVVAAGAVLARSIIRKSDASAEQEQNAFATIQPVGIQDVSPPKTEVNPQDTTAAKTDEEIPEVANAKIERDENVPIKASPALWRPGLDSMASLGKVAADTDAVFILLAADNQESNQTAIKQVEAAAQTIQSNGIRIAAFRLSQGAPNYANLTEQLSAPCVLALVKGGSVSGVSADQITESKLVQAYVAASRPSSGCCGPGASCGP